MQIDIRFGNKHWSFGKIKNSQTGCKQPPQGVPVKVDFCGKCGCILFEEESMCPDCLTPKIDNKGWST